MKIITDTHARPWTVNINVATIKRVRSLLNIDMLEPESFLILTQDVISLCDILYVVCKEEADQRSLSEEQFLASFGGPMLNEAFDVLMEAYTDFFPDQALRKRLQILAEKTKVAREKTLALVEKQTPLLMQQIDQDIEKILHDMDVEMENTIASGSTSTNVPVSSASTRRRSPSAK